MKYVSLCFNSLIRLEQGAVSLGVIIITIPLQEVLLPGPPEWSPEASLCWGGQTKGLNYMASQYSQETGHI